VTIRPISEFFFRSFQYDSLDNSRLPSQAAPQTAFPRGNYHRRSSSTIQVAPPELTASRAGWLVHYNPMTHRLFK